MFYIVCNNLAERTALIKHLREKEIYPVFHYQSLHKSAYFLKNNKSIELPQSDYYTDCLLRLPFYFELSNDDQRLVINSIVSFYTE